MLSYHRFFSHFDWSSMVRDYSPFTYSDMSYGRVQIPYKLCFPNVATNIFFYYISTQSIALKDQPNVSLKNGVRNTRTIIFLNHPSPSRNKEGAIHGK